MKVKPIVPEKFRQKKHFREKIRSTLEWPLAWIP
jgi:hypothetical protein